MKGIVLHSIVPVRSAAAEESEQLTQLLFAETCDILEELPRWKRIRNHTDGEEGWVDFKMITPMTEEEYHNFSKADLSALVRMPMAFAVSENNGQTIPLTAGTRLPDYKDGQFQVLGVRFRIDPSMVTTPLSLTKDNFLSVTRFLLNTPYLWGGKNALGMDCSGFTGIVMSIFGHQLPRNARQQVALGNEVPFLQEAQCGDLAFFDHRSRNAASTNISHVGILLDNEHIIHCSGRVKVERIDATGIISSETGEHTHDLRIIKRL
ncbi:MAG: C40 family peptidase [Paludibacter sp.]|nr:C40 family peptidase [Bacteroidales bacterium]MCM1068459.1 C40 family peptidase [Prevotella sp.]MCM1353413.1 C40 family peptidase [Bacteroides sp.]MCM1442574.1 C40 family peptidase [Muribaculum sp.]MCM1481419.1 C40 family peptidase [Paludibacter sp.]